MTKAGARLILPILRAWLDGGSPDDDDRNARRIAEFIIEKPCAVTSDTSSSLWTWLTANFIEPQRRK